MTARAKQAVLLLLVAVLVGRRKWLYFPTALHGPVVTCDTSVSAKGGKTKRKKEKRKKGFESVGVPSRLLSLTHK